MKESEESRERPRDRLSELPDSIVFEIYGLLPMRDVVRTSILSKRWKNLWITTPYLHFNDHAPEFVNRALILWRGSRILKFNFGYRYLYNESGVSDFDLWVRLAKDCGVQEFVFHNWNPRFGYKEVELYYCVPRYLYSCTSLKVLYLEGCNLLQIHGNVQWNQLRSLMIEECIIDEHFINQVVSGSPQLEFFVLTLSFRDDNLSIQSTSLKELVIERNFDDDNDDDDDDEPSKVSELRIWSPNLEMLQLAGVPYAKYSLENVSSLTDLTLEFTCDADLVGEIFGQILPALQQVEKLTFACRCIEVLGDMKRKDLLSPLSNCNFLTMKISYVVQYGEIVNLLHIFPKLETLVLLFDYDPSEYENHADSSLQVERHLPKSLAFLLQLRAVEITCDERDSLIFPLIGVLLKCASKLQKMVIRVKLETKPSSIPLCLTLQQKLLRMPRSSPTAELIVAGAEY